MIVSYNIAMEAAVIPPLPDSTARYAICWAALSVPER